MALVPCLHWVFERSDTLTPALLNWLDARMGFDIAAHLVALWALAFGLVLYVVRCHWPRFYGAVEIAVGVYIATFLVNRLLGRPVELGPTENGSAFFTIVASLYVIVRGLDNFHRSPDAKPRRTILWDRGLF